MPQIQRKVVQDQDRSRVRQHYVRDGCSLYDTLPHIRPLNHTKLCQIWFHGPVRGRKLHGGWLKVSDWCSPRFGLKQFGCLGSRRATTRLGVKATVGWQRVQLVKGVSGGAEGQAVGDVVVCGFHCIPKTSPTMRVATKEHTCRIKHGIFVYWCFHGTVWVFTVTRQKHGWTHGSLGNSKSGIFVGYFWWEPWVCSGEIAIIGTPKTSFLVVQWYLAYKPNYLKAKQLQILIKKATLKIHKKHWK